MTAPQTTPRRVLVEGAVYWGDNGRRLCAACAGASALYTGCDLSGHPVARATTRDVRVWESEGDLGPLACECGRVRLSIVAGPAGWPTAEVSS